jgi:hypothetical protein
MVSFRNKSLVKKVSPANQDRSDSQDVILENEVRNTIRKLGLSTDADGMGKLGGIPSSTRRTGPERPALVKTMRHVVSPIPPNDRLAKDGGRITGSSLMMKMPSKISFEDSRKDSQMSSQKYSRGLPSNDLIIDLAGSKWYNYPLEELEIEGASKLTADKIKERKAEAQLLLERDSQTFIQLSRKMNRSEYGWIETVLRSGTVSDKVAAWTVLIQQSFVHQMIHLESLLMMASKKGRRESIMAIDTLKELFLTDLLPDRKLKSFEDHDLSSTRLTNEHLMLWYVEDRLKDWYLEFLRILEIAIHDTLYFYKSKAVNTLWSLLAEKPEQEGQLLGLLVNKLGDTEKKLCSKVAFLLLQLLEKHPNMNAVIVHEIDQFLHRHHLGDRAHYYAICFLSQILLRKQKDSKVANHLIKLYFRCFQQWMLKEEVESKLLAAALTGINRAFVYADIDHEL